MSPPTGVLAQRPVAPLADLLDVALAVSGRCIPELPEVGAALVGRIFAPEQFAGHLGVEPHQERFDEFRVGLEQHDCLLRHVLQTREEVVLREITQGLVHGLWKLGRVQDGFEWVTIRQESPGRSERSLHPRFDGIFGIDTLEHCVLGLGQVHRWCREDHSG